MAARATAAAALLGINGAGILQSPSTMATNSENTTRIIGAIDAATARTERQIADVNVGLAGLRSDVGYLKTESSYVKDSLRSLGEKVDSMDQAKAGRSDLQAVESRIERQIIQSQTQTNSAIERVDRDKVGHNQLSVDTFESIVIRIGETERQGDAVIASMKSITEKLAEIQHSQEQSKIQIEELARWKWTVVGAYTAVAGIFTVLGWAAGHLHLFGAVAGH